MKKAALTAFRHLPAPVRRFAVHAGTPSYTAGAVVVLRRDGRILLVDQRHSGGWALPGGLLRRGESPLDGVVREVAEEVGVRLDPAELPVPFAAVDPRVRRIDVVYLLDVALDTGARREDDAEVRGVGWFPLDALPEVTDATVDILTAVRLT